MFRAPRHRIGATGGARIPRPGRSTFRAVRTSTYTVGGMTCAHCAASVTEEIEELGGVRGVEIDVASGAVTVTSDLPLDADAVRKAVEEAGYTLLS